ncbi:MAG: hypothetical protein LBF42_01890 [Puniceicoccales bacterium]|nr:hypothetical protein [Puniceicoccales bacterium]
MLYFLYSDRNEANKEIIACGPKQVLSIGSWGLVSSAAQGTKTPCGETALYGAIPVCSVLTSVLTNGFCRGCQKKLVVMPFSDFR